MSSFVPSSDIVSWHNAARPGGGSNTFTFSGVEAGNLLTCLTSLGGTCPNTYVYGALAGGLGLIITGFVFLIVFLIAYCCASCRCCGRCKPKASQSTGGLVTAWAIPGVRLVVGIINFALLLSGIAYTTDLVAGLSAISTFVTSITVALTSISTVMTAPASTSTQYTLTDFGGTVSTTKYYGILYSQTLAFNAAASVSTSSDGGATSLQAKCTPSSGASGVCVGSTSTTLAACCVATNEVLANIAKGLNPASSSLASGASSLTSASSGISGLNFATDSLQSTIKTAINGLLGVMAAVVIMHAILICRTCLASCAYKSCSPINIILNFIVFLLAGIFWLIGTFGADLCYSPATFLASTLNVTELTWMLTCATNPSVAKPSFITSLGLVNTTMYAAVANTTIVSKTASTLPFTANYASSVLNLAPVTSNLGNMAGTLSGVLGVVSSCSGWDSLWATFFKSLCNGTILGFISLAKVLCAAGVFMLVQLALGVEVCAYHPGDKKAWKDGGGAVEPEHKEGVKVLVVAEPGSTVVVSGGASTAPPPEEHHHQAGGEGEAKDAPAV